MNEVRSRWRIAYNIIRNDGILEFLLVGINSLLNKPIFFKFKVYFQSIMCGFKYGKAAPNPYKIIWVDPSSINYWRPNHDLYNIPEINLNIKNKDGFDISCWDDAGKVIGGDWDKEENLVPFDQTPKYCAVENHFQNQTPWKETQIYDVILHMVSKRGRFDGCSNIDDIKKRYGEIDELYEKICEKGYISRKESSNTYTLKQELSEVGVSIGRDGEIIFQGDGWHRLSIAKLLNIDEIPVRVIIRHSEWQKKRDEIVSVKSNSNMKIDLDHPDLEDLLDSTA